MMGRQLFQQVLQVATRLGDDAEAPRSKSHVLRSNAARLGEELSEDSVFFEQIRQRDGTPLKTNMT